MKYKALSKKYDDLEQEVIYELKELISMSKIESKFTNNKVIKVNVFDYQELTVFGNDLVFLDNNGHNYALYSECSLEDLIDILNKI